MGWEDPREKEMATHSRILAWKIPWTEEPDGLQSIESKNLDATERLNHQTPRAHSTWYIFSELDKACGILLPGPGIEPMSPAVEA